MPGILKEDKEEVVMGEKTNGKLHISEKLKGEAKAMEDPDQGKEGSAPHHVVDAGGSVSSNGMAGEVDVCNGRMSRDSSTSDSGG